MQTVFVGGKGTDFALSLLVKGAYYFNQQYAIMHDSCISPGELSSHCLEEVVGLTFVDVLGSSLAGRASPAVRVKIFSCLSITSSRSVSKRAMSLSILLRRSETFCCS